MLDGPNRRTNHRGRRPKVDWNGRTRPKTKLATHRLQNFHPKFQRCIRQIFWYIFLKDGGPSQRAKAWTCEHVFAPVFTDSGHQNCVQWRWIVCVGSFAGLLVSKMVTVPCFEPKTCKLLVTLHLFPSFACLKGVRAAQRKCQGQKSSPKNET